jgi:hypothetical protein
LSTLVAILSVTVKDGEKGIRRFATKVVLDTIGILVGFLRIYT